MKKIFAFLMAVLLILPITVGAQAPEAGALEQEKGQAVIDAAAQMTFPADNSDVQMRCPVCEEVVTWLAWGVDAEINTRDNRYLENRHLYLTSDFIGTQIDDPKTNTWGWVFSTGNANEHSVIHLNGKTLKAAQGGIACFDGEVNVIGDGYVWGNRGTNEDFSANLDAGEGGVLNVYGGTYYKTANQPLLQVNGAGSTFNLYGGKLEGNDAKTAGTVTVEAGGSFFVYGGIVENGYLSTDGDTLLVSPTATAAIYGGTVSGGKDSSGGNIFVSGTLEIHGGTINGAVKTGEGQLIVTGGKLDSVVTGENITIQGGSFSTNITRYVPEGVQLRQKDGWYTVGAAAKLDLTWLWLAIAGEAVLAAVLVPVLIITIKKKKQNG